MSEPKYEINSPNMQCIQVRAVGSCELSFRVEMTRDEFLTAIEEHGRVFRLHVAEYNADTRQGKITLVPDNGVVGFYRDSEQVTFSTFGDAMKQRGEQ